ncbi:hypothetical protein BIV23_44060 [Streptomyces monashensis]|uniref:Uncharacterized protein n=2 Tax=Streptomyces monashensis TaxID=1678012 RepID=A0A1S2NY06_9ACTN|nr:hypothetical protein BIV23_44060 [Streptomyces monashensis]
MEARQERIRAAGGHGTDQAVLLGTALVATITVNSDPSNWGPTDSIIGIVLLLIIGAHYRWSEYGVGWDRAVKTWTFAAITALCVCLVAAFPELKISGSEDTTDTWLIPITWAVSTPILWAAHVKLPVRGNVRDDAAGRESQESVLDVRPDAAGSDA